MNNSDYIDSRGVRNNFRTPQDSTTSKNHVDRDAGRRDVDTEGGASKFDLAHYGKLIDKA